MKNLHSLFIIIASILFFVACEKENEAKLNTISGVVSAGENVTTNELNTISIRLGNLHNGVDVSTTTIKKKDFDWIENTEINSNGSFSFKNLENGNYIVPPSSGFIFAIDTFAIITIDGKTLNKINKTIQRDTPENALYWPFV
jgi:hypothetical protein